MEKLKDILFILLIIIALTGWSFLFLGFNFWLLSLIFNFIFTWFKVFIIWLIFQLFFGIMIIINLNN